MQCSPSWWFQIAAFWVSITGDKEQLNWIVTLCINFLLTLSFQHCSSLSYSCSLSPLSLVVSFPLRHPSNTSLFFAFYMSWPLKFPRIYVWCHHSVCGGELEGCSSKDVFQLFLYIYTLIFIYIYIHICIHTCCGCVIFNPVQCHWCSLLALYLHTWLVTLLTKQRKKTRQNKKTEALTSCQCTWKSKNKDLRYCWKACQWRK